MCYDNTLNELLVRLNNALIPAKSKVQMINSIRYNMKSQLLPLYDKFMLKRRSIIEAINDQLKNVSQIEHSRHLLNPTLWLIRDIRLSPILRRK